MDIFHNFCSVIFTLFHLIILVLTNESNETHEFNEIIRLDETTDFNDIIQSNENNVDTNMEITEDGDRAQMCKLNRIAPSSSFVWPRAVVPFYLDTTSYDSIIASRIRAAMDVIESSSCVLFKNEASIPKNGNWLHITNPDQEKDCVHQVQIGQNGEAMLVLGFECMQRRDILHSLLHALSFKDEVSHAQRDQFIRIIWENIQPKYRALFHISLDETPYKRLVEYDTMSVMQFHDRAFSINGRPTIVPQIPGLVIDPSEKLSQLDIMKLRLAFGHECNKRKVSKLVDTCKEAMFRSSSQEILEDRENLAGANETDAKAESHRQKMDGPLEP